MLLLHVCTCTTDSTSPKVHLTPNLFCLIKSTFYLKDVGKKIFEFTWILDFLCPFKVALEVLNNPVLGNLGRRLLMMSTQEPNTLASQSALSIYLRKWKEKGIIPTYFGTYTVNIQVLFQNHFSFVTGVRVKFQFERLWNKLWSATFDNLNFHAA